MSYCSESDPVSSKRPKRNNLDPRLFDLLEIICSTEQANFQHDLTVEVNIASEKTIRAVNKFIGDQVWLSARRAKIIVTFVKC